jgi:hypothetical protein
MFFLWNYGVRKILRVNHCVGIVKKIQFFSYWALCCKCVELGAIFDLLLFNVCLQNDDANPNENYLMVHINGC